VVPVLAQLVSFSDPQHELTTKSGTKTANAKINKIDFHLNFIQFHVTVIHMFAPSRELLRKRREREHPLLLMPEEDLDFVLQFVLASGSLKEMARLHGVSYPTIRASLDRVIENLRQRLNGAPPDPMTNLLADLVERGEIKLATAKSIRAIYRTVIDKDTDEEESQ